jgi:hypothetical protein
LPPVLASKLIESDNADLSTNSAAEGDQYATKITEMHIRGRYLMALRCSYASQTQAGMLSGLASRQIKWAIDAAIDHCNDEPEIASDLEHDMKHFDWGWLVDEGFLQIPKWLKLVEHALTSLPIVALVPKAWCRRILWYFSRRQHARCMELLLCVARAHSETLRSESKIYGKTPPLAAKRVMDTSLLIKIRAQDEYAMLRQEFPDIASAVHTRQTCQLVLNDFDDQVENLHQTAQISDQEFAAIQKEIVSKRRRLLYHMPRQNETQQATHRFVASNPMSYITFNHVTPVHSHLARSQRISYYLSGEAAVLSKFLIEEHFEPHQVVLSECGIAGAIYIIDSGVVRVGCNTEGRSGSLERTQSTLSVLSLNGLVDEDEPDRSTILGDGCCINESEFLLHASGYCTYNVDRVIAVTHVKVLCLSFEDMILEEAGFLALLENMWKIAGKTLFTRGPHLFDFVPIPSEFQWESGRLECYEIGRSILISGPVLLVKGSLVQQKNSIRSSSSSRIRFSVSKRQRQNTRIESFKYLGPTETECFVFTVDSDHCMLFLSGQGSVAHAEVCSEAETPQNSPIAQVIDGRDKLLKSSKEKTSLYAIEEVSTSSMLSEHVWRKLGIDEQSGREDAETLNESSPMDLPSPRGISHWNPWNSGNIALEGNSVKETANRRNDDWEQQGEAIRSSVYRRMKAPFFADNMNRSTKSMQDMLQKRPGRPLSPTRSPGKRQDVEQTDNATRPVVPFKGQRSRNKKKLTSSDIAAGVSLNGTARGSREEVAFVL